MATQYRARYVYVTVHEEEQPEDGDAKVVVRHEGEIIEFEHEDFLQFYVPMTEPSGIIMESNFG